MNTSWDPATPGLLKLPSGRLVRGRGLKHSPPDGPNPNPTFAVYLLGRPPPAVPWESRWLRWPDFGLPADRDEIMSALTEAWRRAEGERVEFGCAGGGGRAGAGPGPEGERVEFGCAGGRGRTGTALACLAILDGVPSSQAVAFVRQHYDRRAVETRRQRRYVARFVVM